MVDWMGTLHSARRMECRSLSQRSPHALRLVSARSMLPPHYLLFITHSSQLTAHSSPLTTYVGGRGEGGVFMAAAGGFQGEACHEEVDVHKAPAVKGHPLVSWRLVLG